MPGAGGLNGIPKCLFLTEKFQRLLNVPLTPAAGIWQEVLRAGDLEAVGLLYYGSGLSGNSPSTLLPLGARGPVETSLFHTHMHRGTGVRWTLVGLENGETRRLTQSGEDTPVP